MRNIELKARLADPDAAREVARQIATNRPDTQQQVDTYFHCRAGRLKLRKINGLSAMLVWYAREDRQAAKPSDYLLVPLSNPHALEQALTAALGVQAVVSKRREIFFWGNVRIHLDEVAELGSFLEFEAVLGPQVDDAAGRAQLDELRERFALDPADLLADSYADMILRGTHPSSSP